ncbi:MAG: Hemolysin activation/secretion protein [Verrucomicrobia bacterium]|nr:MAG: Hemolysin activation/secretion protein [Verrucomicrobiota bacterium]
MNCSHNLFPSATLVAVVLAHVAVAPLQADAQTPPDVGGVLQQMKRPPEPTQKSSTPVPKLPTAAPQIAPGGVKVVVRSFVFGGNESIGSEELNSILGDAFGKPADMATLGQLAFAVGEFYHTSGYPFARAYLPVQEVSSGVVRFEVQEGRYGEVQAKGKNPFWVSQTQTFLGPLKTGELIKSKRLERVTLMLDDLPGTKFVPVMHPGEEVGTGDLTVFEERGKLLSGQLGVDNYGNRYTGAYRLNTAVNINSPFLMGDQISLTSSVTDEALWFGSANYALPLGGMGLRANAGFSHTQYELGSDFKSSNTTGTADIFSAGMSYQWVRSTNANLKLVLGYQHKELHEDVNGNITNKRSETVPVSAEFELRDTFAGAGVTYGSVSFTQGALSLPTDRLAGDFNHTDGAFSKANIDVMRIQSLPLNFTLFGRAGGQLAGDNLDSSEKMSLGGASGVRAFPNGEALGDTGWMTQLELRKTLGKYTPYAFVDAGGIQVNQSPTAGQDNTRNLGGAGVGLRYQRDKWELNSSVAWRAWGGAPEADTHVKGGRPCVWVGANWRF